jgi:hypothetical protein
MPCQPTCFLVIGSDARILGCSAVRMRESNRYDHRQMVPVFVLRAYWCCTYIVARWRTWGMRHGAGDNCDQLRC